AAVFAGAEPVRHTGPGRTRDDVPWAQGVLLGPLAIPRERRVRLQVQRGRAFEDHEDLLFLGVRVGHRSGLAGREALPGHPGELRVVPIREPRPGLVALALELDLVDVADVLGTRLHVAHVERLHGRLDVPRVVVAALGPRPADADRARAGQPADLGRVARPEHEILEPFRPGDEGVLVLIGAMDDAVARLHLVHLAVLPGEPGAGEHVVELFGRAVRVRGRRQLARRDANAVQADALRACCVAEALPFGVHLALCVAVPRDIVPV